MPGRVARAVEPNVVGLLAGRLPGGTVLVAGTNGKTITAHLIAHIMRAEGRRVVHNRAGANLAAGIASALVEHADLCGAPAGDLGIFEVDEATVPRVVPALAPRVAVFTNLFRDQLDRYGEIDYISGLWRAAGDAGHAHDVRPRRRPPRAARARAHRGGPVLLPLRHAVHLRGDVLRPHGPVP